MNDNEIRQGFEKMTEAVQPERMEDAVRERLAVKEERKRMRIRFPRTAVAVACVLAVTALSAGAYAVRRNITIQPYADGHGPYLVMTHANEDILKFPLLAEEIVEQIGERCVKDEDESNDDFYERRLKFSSWEEAEEWLGCDLLISDMLSEPQTNTIWGADILVQPVYIDEELYYVHLISTHLVENAEEHMLCYMDIILPVSETFLGWVRDGIFGKSGNLHGGEPEGKPEVMNYHTENGLDAEIAGMYKRYDGSHINNPVVYHVNSYVMHEGILYDIAIWEKDRDFTIQTMQDILDSLE